jgi:hypothetical protein
MKNMRKRKSIEELESISQTMIREALSGFTISKTVSSKLALAIGFDDNLRIFQLYIPAADSLNARIICQATVDSYSGEGSVEVFLNEYPDGIRNEDLAKREKGNLGGIG